MRPDIPENLYKGELVNYPGPWAFQIPRSSIILVSDKELEALADPDKKLNLSMGREPREISLREVCEKAQARGARTLIIAFDHFFAQYRPGQDDPRKLTPDMDEYVKRIAKVSKFAEGYGLGLELSLLTPLEIGPAYRAKTGESGVWMQYRKGYRNPKTGDFSVQLWRQKAWTNNKGVIDPEDAGVRVFAFREEAIGGTPYRVVDPKGIVEITDAAKTDVWESDGGASERINVHGKGKTDIGGLDRVLVVQMYRTPEMDYFSDKALPFLNEMVDKYAAAGVKLNALYSDEMHIQQDWSYFNHHENGEFAMRYVSPGLAREFAKRYGSEYKDFAKYMVYFCYGQEDYSTDVNAKAGVMHVFGPTPEDIRRTALFRSNYYRLLQDGVTDLFTEAKHHAEGKYGYRLESRGHATWAESPTIDKVNTGQENNFRNLYEYTSNFVWSCTVHQSSAACSDYFKWGDFLTGNGNDHAESGWLDRNYLGLALACSTGILNEVPYSYACHWGMPKEVGARRGNLVDVYGTAGSPYCGIVQDLQHRDVDVLSLYPLDLVSVEERFGSWMTQYGYWNMVTADKLLERGKVSGGAIEMAGRRFTTLVAVFEPFPSKRLLDMMKELAESGGRVIWSGPPPVLTREGKPALQEWQEIFGVEYKPTQNEGFLAPGRQVEFDGVLGKVAPQTILTDFLVDRIYRVIPKDGTSAVARVKGQVVGTCRTSNRGGTATFLGYRPRDDQSASLGYETRNWFEVLNALGAYPSTGKFPGANDNTEYISRTTGCLTCRFPNGTVAITNHFRSVEEDWDSGFARDKEKDNAWLAKHPLPSNEISLKDFKVNGHTVSYDGAGSVAFRVNEKGDLIAFAGSWSKSITIDGREFIFAESPAQQIAWSPVGKDRQVPGGAVFQAISRAPGKFHIPASGLPENLELVAEGVKPGSRGEVIPSKWEGDVITFEVTEATKNRWIYGLTKG